MCVTFFWVFWLILQLNGTHHFFDLRFHDITGLSRTFFIEFKDIFLQIPGHILFI